MNISEITVTAEISNASKNQEREGHTAQAEGVVHAEIGIIPIGKCTSIERNDIDENMIQPSSSTITSTSSSTTSMSREIAIAYDAIYHVKGIRTILTGMGTQIESKNVHNILQAVEAAHHALKKAGIKRIITSVHIDERLDKASTLEDKAGSVKEKLHI